MENKLTKEYAEKLAIEMLKPNWGHCFMDDKLFQEPMFFKLEKEGIIEGYLKAIEETNAKELLEALQSTKQLNLHLYEIGTIGHEVYNKITNAINKATK